MSNGSDFKKLGEKRAKAAASSQVLVTAFLERNNFSAGSYISEKQENKYAVSKLVNDISPVLKTTKMNPPCHSLMNWCLLISIVM
jgi:hypothetical protein